MPRAVATLLDRAYEQLCSSIGFGGRRAVDLEHAGLRALGIYRLRSQIGLTFRSIGLWAGPRRWSFARSNAKGKSGNAVPNPPRFGKLLTSILIALNDAIAAALQMLDDCRHTRLAS